MTLFILKYIKNNHVTKRDVFFLVQTARDTLNDQRCHASSLSLSTFSTTRSFLRQTRPPSYRYSRLSTYETVLHQRTSESTETTRGNFQKPTEKKTAKKKIEVKKKIAVKKKSRSTKKNRGQRKNASKISKNSGCRFR